MREAAQAGALVSQRLLLSVDVDPATSLSAKLIKQAYTDSPTSISAFFASLRAEARSVAGSPSQYKIRRQ